MSEYTKRQAILDCRETWSELAKSGGANKLSTKFFKRTKITCAFCKHASATGCFDCLAYGRWGKSKDSYTCLSPNSFFKKWGAGGVGISENPSIRSRRYWARQIVKLCDTLMAELDAEEEK